MPKPPNGTSPELLRGNFRVVDSATYPRLLAESKAKRHGSGFAGRDWKAVPYGSSAAAAPIEANPRFEMIPRGEWFDRYMAMQRLGVTPDQIARRYKIRSRSQQSSSSCWMWSVVQQLRYRWAMANNEVPDLSPTSTVCFVTGNRDRGGMMIEALEGLREFGILTTDKWSLNDFSPNPHSAAMRRDAAKRKVLEGYDLPLSLNNGRLRPAAERLDVAVSAFLTIGPPSSGHTWMGHAIQWRALRFKNGKLVTIGTDNSGLYRDANGQTDFSVDRMAAEDGVVPTVQRYVE